MATFKVTSNSLNPYESARDMLQGTPLYTELGGDDSWNQYAKRGELDSFVSVLADADKLGGIDKFINDYETKFLTNEQKLMAAATELYSDRNTLNKYTEQYVDEADGKLKEREVEMTEYDWNRKNISALVKQGKEKYEREQIEKSKQDNAALSTFLTIVAVPERVFSSAVGALNQWAMFGEASYNFVSQSIMNGFEAGDKAFRETYAEGNAVTEWLQDIERWEAENTFLRDVDGNYTTVGKVFGTIADSIGQFLPTAVINFATGGIGGTAGSVIHGAANFMYWGSMASANFEEFAKDPNMASVPTYQLVLNSSFRAALEYGVQWGLNKILGSTSMDKLIFGYSSQKPASNALTRIFRDALHEGVEEMLQEASGYMVQSFFEIVNEDFGIYADQYTLQTFVDAFVLGILGSLFSSAIDFTLTRRFDTNEAKIDKEGNIKVDRYGNVKYKKFSKLSSFNMKYDLQSMNANINAVLKDDTLSTEQRQQAYLEAYSAYRTLSTYFGAIGQERFEQANNLLVRMENTFAKSNATKTQLKESARLMLTEYQIMVQDYYDASGKKAEEAIADAKMTKVQTVVRRNDSTEDIKLPEDKASVQKVIDNMLKEDEGLNTVVVTEDGTNIVSVGDTLFVPVKYLELGADGNIIYKTMAEQKLVKNTMSAPMLSEVNKKILETYKVVKNDNSATLEQAIYETYFNPQFYEILLSTATHDMYKFLSRVDQIERAAVGKTIKDAIYKKRISDVRTEMKKSLIIYLVNQQNAEFEDLTILNAQQKKFVRDHRFNKTLAAKIINELKVTDEEWNSVMNRINGLDISEQDKEALRRNVQSTGPKNRSLRQNALAAIDRQYDDIYFGPYNGRTYLQNNTIPNATWNSWAKAAGITVDTIMSPATDPDVIERIQESQGSITPEAQLAYYKEGFEQYTHGKYTFDYKNRRVIVKENTQSTQYGYTKFDERRSDIYSGKIKNQTLVQKSEKAYRNIMTPLVSNDIDAVSRAYITIDDLVREPNLLSKSIKEQIQKSPYKELTPENVFLFLRRKILDKSKGTVSLIVGSDGRYYLADVKPMFDILINQEQSFEGDAFDTKEPPTIDKLVKPEYLQGNLKNVKVKWSSKSEYDAQTNTIYLDINARNDARYMRFAFAHEFQHAMQVETRINNGINQLWLHNPSINKTNRTRIINDIRKHRPELFTDVKVGSTQELDIAERFIYDTSNEMQSYGLEASEINDFYPTYVYSNKDGTFVVTPWGTKYKLGDNSTESLATNRRPSRSFTTEQKNELDKALEEVTEEYSLSDFSKTPAPVFIDEDGRLHKLPKGEHHYEQIEHIAVLTGMDEADVEQYLLGLPQVTVQTDRLGTFAAVRIPLDMSRSTLNNVLLVMDALSNHNIDYDLGESYLSNVDPSSVVVSSSDYDTSDDVFDAFIREYRMSQFNRQSIAEDSVSQPSEKYPRYVSNKEAQKSNLKYFIRKNKPIQLDKRVQDLVVEADPERINKGLWRFIGGEEKGTLNVHKVFEYIRTADRMNDYTFDLINRTFFQNTAIKNFAQLKAYADVEMDKYYALRAVLKAFNKESYLDKRMSHAKMEAIIQELMKRPEWAKIYTEVLDRYSLYKHELELDIDRQNARVMFMKYFDGTVNSAGHIASIAKWLALTEYVAETKYKTPGKVSTISTETSVAEDLKLEDMLSDESSIDAFNEVLDDYSETEQMERIIEARYQQFYLSEEFASMSKSEIRQRQYEIRMDVEENMTQDQIRQEFASLYFTEDEDAKYQDAVKKGIEAIVRPRKNIVSNIKRMANVTIAQNLSQKDMERFKRAHPGFFTDDNRLNPELYRGKSVQELQTLENEVRELSRQVRSGVFKGQMAQNIFVKLERERRKNERLKQKVDDLQEQVQKYKTTQKVVFANDYEFTINADRPMPTELKAILDDEFTEFSQSKVKYITDETDQNVKITMKSFFDASIVRISQLTQQDIDEIIDYYAHSQVMSMDFERNDLRKYDMFKVYMLTYLTKAAKEGQWVFSEQQLSDIHNTLMAMVTGSSSILGAWANAMEMVNPNKRLAMSIAKQTGITFPEHYLDSLASALNMPVTKDKESIEKKAKAVKQAVSSMEYFAVNNAKVTERVTIFDKLTRFQKMMMLSSPGTWLRNITSNVVVTQVNRKGAAIGDRLVRLFSKGKKKNVTGQWKITGVKVSQEVNDFSDAFLDRPIYDETVSTKDGVKYKPVSLYDAVSDGLTKYDPHRMQTKGSSDPIVQGIARKISADIFNNHAFDTKSKKRLAKLGADALNKTNAFIMRMLSDDPWIKKETYYLFKRMLQQSDILEQYVKKNWVKEDILPEYQSEFEIATDNKKMEIAYKYTNWEARDARLFAEQSERYKSDLKSAMDDQDVQRYKRVKLGKPVARNEDTQTTSLLQAALNNANIETQLNDIFMEAYKFAAYEYMRRPNIMNKFENVIRERLGAPGYFIYKQILPFASASWNWFVEGLNYTPIGLAKGIIQFARLEDTVQKMDERRGITKELVEETYTDPITGIESKRTKIVYKYGKGDYNLPSGRFAEYIAKQNIGKGVIGTIGMIAGIILVATGTAGVDDEDGKLKLHVADQVWIDITDLFGSQGILVGMAIASPYVGEGSWWDKISSSMTATVSQLFNDSIFNDVMSMFEYTDTFGDWFFNQTEEMLSMFVPNFVKTFNSMLYTHQVSYSKGILGWIEYFGVSAIPGLAYALPKKIDPYTGKVTSKFNLPWLVNFINKMTPIDVQPYNVSDIERIALSVGVNKGELTGRYEDIGTLSTKDRQTLNEYYGKLNAQDLHDFIYGNALYRVKMEDGTYKELRYRQMTSEQIKSVINRIMTDNAKCAKVYVWTSNGGKYYGTESEVQELKNLGMKNVYIKTNKTNGFI